MYNLSGVSSLNLSPETLAGIYTGKITRWDDQGVKADNQGSKLPSIPIQVVHRSDGSGTTSVFTSYLSATAPAVWTAGSGKDVAWPAGLGAKGSDGVAAAVKQAEGAIGYAELSFAKGASLRVAKVKNLAGGYVAPTADSVSAALAGAEVPADLKVKVNYVPGDPAAYPLSTTSWVIFFSKPADAAKGKLTKSFVAYALAKGQDSAKDLSYAPLPKDLQSKAQAAVTAP
jgi:phosphate transport system substrate-binding protein